MPLFYQIPPFLPALIVSVMLCAILSLNLVSPLGAWSFRPVLHKDSCLLRPTHLPWWRMTKPLHALILVACSSHNLILCSEDMVQTEDDIKCIQCKSVSLSQDDYPINALHVWAENNPVNEHNLKNHCLC